MKQNQQSGCNSIVAHQPESLFLGTWVFSRDERAAGGAQTDGPEQQPARRPPGVLHARTYLHDGLHRKLERNPQLQLTPPNELHR